MQLRCGRAVLRQSPESESTRSRWPTGAYAYLCSRIVSFQKYASQSVTTTPGFADAIRDWREAVRVVKDATVLTLVVLMAGDDGWSHGCSRQQPPQDGAPTQYCCVTRGDSAKY